MCKLDIAVRRLRYRLNRQGMLELDAWLGALQQVDMQAPGMVAAIALLLDCEAPELQAMMHGEKEVPECLKPWL